MFKELVKYELSTSDKAKIEKQLTHVIDMLKRDDTYFDAKIQFLRIATEEYDAYGVPILENTEKFKLVIELTIDFSHLTEMKVCDTIG